MRVDIKLRALQVTLLCKIQSSSSSSLCHPAGYRKERVRYDRIEQFNVVSKAQCGQFNISKKETKTNASAHSRYRFVIREGSPKGI